MVFQFETSVKLIIVRHGETDWNVEGRFQGFGESNLTHRGLKQAVRAGQALSQERFDCIYSSPSRRAVDTAKAILDASKHPQQPVATPEALREVNFGILEGQRHSDIEHFGVDVSRHLTDAPPQGESLYQLIDRVRHWLEITLPQHGGQTLLLTCHGGTTMAILCALGIWNPEAFWDQPPGHTAITRVTVDLPNWRARLDRLHDTAHLN